MSSSHALESVSDESRAKVTFDLFAMEAIAHEGTKQQATIDVIVPVYKGMQTTLDCLVSVLKTDACLKANIVVIDDASPEPALSDMLQYLAGLGLITLVKNETNQGFVRTVNGAMARNDNDVILLNSDTIVYGNWVERLTRQAYSAERIGSVTPFSDNATLCSYPLIYDENDIPLEVNGGELDQIMSEVNSARSVEIPTAVGFCMYIRRDCLKEVGLFDAETFGRGYGEENDFCCRASNLGWKHILAGDVYVRHVGSVSFGHEKNELQRVNTAILRSRYPDFLPAVARWSSIDPPSVLRKSVDAARVRRASPAPILFVCHDLGGGTERHLQDMIDALEREGQPVVVMRPIKTFRTKFFIESKNIFVPNLNPYDFVEASEELITALRSIGVRHIHIHSLFDMDLSIVDILPAVAAQLGVKYDVTLHEYLSICPRTFLINETGFYCGEPDIDTCQSCVEKNGSHFGAPSMSKWRQSYSKLLETARKIFVPNADVRDRIHKHYPRVLPTVRPHVEKISNRAARPFLPRAQNETLRVALIGVLAEHKGALVVDAMLADAKERKLPIEFVLFGEREKPVSHSSNRLLELGPYQEEEIYDLLEANPCHMVLFPAVWPETFSYTLSIAIQFGLYPVAFDLGAISERLKAMAWGTLLPTSLMNDPQFVNDVLLRLLPVPRPANCIDVLSDCTYANFLKDYYELKLDG